MCLTDQKLWRPILIESTALLLEVEKIVTGYGKREVLKGVSLEVRSGEIVALIGHNGAGKSTVLRTVFALLPCWQGIISIEGKPLEIVDRRTLIRAGVAYVPQGNRVFAN